MTMRNIDRKALGDALLMDLANRYETDPAALQFLCLRELMRDRVEALLFAWEAAKKFDLPYDPPAAAPADIDEFFATTTAADFIEIISGDRT